MDNNNNYSDSNQSYEGLSPSNFDQSYNNSNYNQSYEQQAFSGMDNGYNSNPNLAQYLGSVPEPDKRPGCLTSLLGFFLTIVLMITLTAGLILLGLKSSISSGMDAFVDITTDVIYDEIANDTDLKNTLEMVDCELSDFIPEDMLDKMADDVTDVLTNGVNSKDLKPELDYDKISDDMYDVSEKVLDKTLDYYVEYYKTGEMPEEGKLLDEFLVDVVGYDVYSDFSSILSAYEDSGMVQEDALEQVKQSTKETALPEIKEEIDYLVYNDLKDAYEEGYEEIIGTDSGLQEYLDILNAFPLIMKGCLIASAVIILLQLIMYRQRYRALRNFSVATAFVGAFFAGFSALFTWAFNDVGKDMNDEFDLMYFNGVIKGLLNPFYIITIGLAVAFVVLIIAQIIMRANRKHDYADYK